MFLPTVPPSAYLQLHQAGLVLDSVAVLHGLSFQIAPGERVGVVGANGSGKSSLLRLLHGLVRPSSGQLVAQPGLRQAMLFQQPHLLRMTVQNNVTLGLWLQGLAWRTARVQALQALAQADLVELVKHPAHTLSVGQQQRVALARALSLKPHLLLLDEPTASLDPYAKREVEARLATLAALSTMTHESQGLALVFASHNLGQVKRLATRVLYLEQGQLLADLPVDSFFNRDVLARVSPAAQMFLQGELV
jgi:tungstate transport system ATP-binding protein